ncbi:MAG: hypothetical protein ACKVUT_05710 [Gaiella sp.]
MRIGLLLAVAVALVPAAFASSSGESAATIVLRLDGIGPLKLGMTGQAAVATGWLAKRSPGCPLGGPPLPITYKLSGPKAPAGVHGIAEFTGGRLRTLSFTRGVRTAGPWVEVGRTTVAQMVSRFRGAGFTASSRYDDVFVGTFVTVRRGGKVVLGAFAEQGPIAILGIPHVPVCE